MDDFHRYQVPGGELRVRTGTGTGYLVLCCQSELFIYRYRYVVMTRSRLSRLLMYVVPHMILFCYNEPDKIPVDYLED